ncbi:hypothetical protein AMTR_s00162p00027060 [Amborella trichopoda]|uniref:Uncharacterized protein n=1 Tax=Amborella trichopoda TaxID=13333 RepID=W1PNN9_AMBTC|nr:hypothetical protein AMTR_s00162p00027060 [Amborella trichopoda]
MEPLSLSWNQIYAVFPKPSPPPRRAPLARFQPHRVVQATSFAEVVAKNNKLPEVLTSSPRIPTPLVSPRQSTVKDYPLCVFVPQFFSAPLKSKLEASLVGSFSPT